MTRAPTSNHKSEPLSAGLQTESVAQRWLDAISRRSAVESEYMNSDAVVGSLLGWADSMGISDETQSRALADVLEIDYEEDLERFQALEEFVARVPIGFARHHTVIGLVDANGKNVLAIGTPEAWIHIDRLSRFLEIRLRAIIAPKAAITVAINRGYEQRTGQAEEVIDGLDKEEVLAELRRYQSSDDLLDVSDRAPVIKLVNAILFEAVKLNASDVHIQPYHERLVARFRIDGVLFDHFEIPKRLQEEATTRIKIMGHMDIAEKRLPQDGRATVRVGDRVIDLRISAIPTSLGERVVIRLLDKSARVHSMTELGMDSRTLAKFRDLIRFDHGLILVTGPTGSGKSTTLYAALQEINSKDLNVVTLEDPIEYQLEGISQTQISEKKGMTFSSGLRHVLRQDPDVIMVGEIRDRETAVMAIQSALTGHLVLSTLHTNDAASAVTRLLDLGIEPYLVASSLVASMAQRLVRQICPHCAQEYEASKFEFLRLGVDLEQAANQSLLRGAGCDKCRNTGYRGRIGLFELLVVNDLVRTQVQTRANASQVRQSALEDGMRLLRDDGLEKILANMTTIDEVTRVTSHSS